ncbi:hypothetical protein Halha_1132 [Halobacteroides halobius DSM 5150]|uniref:Uncharacterized protein n=1 Tax=Halobacteroides halobius (strain ATCC 35273 / DSM 5150 / MD-1) TaxID=748449 RepID=L0K7S6_HALHC|nr:hypothetical protein Halha_1132 [Halobacteroides halobius DSM 5150]
MTLEEALQKIKKTDRKDYEARNKAVLRAMSLALEKGYEAGIRMDYTKPEYPVVYIELPTGQVSWHLPEHRKEWDGHTTEEKYNRIEQYLGA